MGLAYIYLVVIALSIFSYLSDKPWGQSMGKGGKKSFHTYDYTWRRYNRQVCSGNGRCQLVKENTDTKEATATAVCTCNAGYAGKHCHEPTS